MGNEWCFFRFRLNPFGHAMTSWRVSWLIEPQRKNRALGTLRATFAASNDPKESAGWGKAANELTRHDLGSVTRHRATNRLPEFSRQLMES